MSMKTLILINGALGHRPFYTRVGRTLTERGHTVHFALDSHYTDYLYPHTPLPPTQTHYFSDYFRRHSERATPPSQFAQSNIWTLAFPDIERLMFTRFNQKRTPHQYQCLLANIAHFFTSLLNDFRFDSVVYENVSNTFSYVAFESCRHAAVRYVGLLPSRLPGRTDVLDSAMARPTALEPTYRGILSGAIAVPQNVAAWTREYLTRFVEQVPDYMRGQHLLEMGFVSRYARLSPALRFARSMAYRAARPDDLAYAPFLSELFLVFPEQLAREAQRQATRAYLSRHLYNDTPDLSKDYYVYPLQFHPESSSSVDAPSFTDEWANILNVSRTLPFGRLLYVKDHRHAAGRMGLSFYERIARLPNVVLVHPNYDPKTLVRHARGVVTVSSTMGYEALILGKSVFVLGHPFYDFFPSCKRIASFDDAFELFRTHADVSPSAEEVSALVSAYYMVSEAGTLDLTGPPPSAEVVERIAAIVERRTLAS